MIALLVRPDLHAAEPLRRGAGGAGVERQGRRSRSTRRSAPRVEDDPRQGRPQARLRPVRRQLGQGAPRPTSTRSARPRTRSARRSTPIRTTRPTSSRSTCCRARPTWLTALHALPMYLGLDLRGGVHFLMQVDMKAALTKKAESTRRRRAHAAARQERPPHRHQRATADGIVVALPRPRHAGQRRSRSCVDQLPDLALVRRAATAPTSKLTGSLKPDRPSAVQSAALKQNITTLHNRVNELGVAEPVIQQQGAGPRRRSAAGRAGHRQGQGHHRPHRDARNAHGRRRAAEAAPGRRAAPVRCRSATERYVERGGQRRWSSSARCC